MSKTANVIDLEAFRRRKRRDAETTATTPDAAMFVPVWFCWVPIWAPCAVPAKAWGLGT
ncbi:MAG: hypothetical protein KF819_21315 [Labilithrix sp.]|nr:hypothetical protein [Labilithrix sp.]